MLITSGMNYPFRYGINSLMLNDRGERFRQAEFILGIEPRRGGRVRTPWFELDCSGADAGHRHCRGRSGRVTVLGTLGSRTGVIVDLDGDGDLDIVTGDFNSEPQVFVSDLAQRHEVQWLKIRLLGTFSNRDGLGAKVSVYLGDRILTQLHDGKTGYLSQSSVPLYFGLGAATAAERVVVRWPSGAEQIVEGPIAANTTLEIQEE